ncbi:MAG: prepilin-type N-terminal cleavage/methylation domain-containing protein [Patescibacteria group bacterium]
MKKSSGFTLIEILVVTTITLIFLGVGLVQYNTNTERFKLKNEGKKLVDVLELAKKKALSADLQDKNCSNFTGYRVTISSNAYSFKFCCASTCTVVQSYNITTSIAITAGAGDYDFSPLMTRPIFVSDTISLKNSSINKTINISISPIGVIELDETLL